MEVQIVSREIIKPARKESPNDEQKTFQVSVLDNLSPLVYIPIIYFYPMNETDNRDPTIENTIARLKFSLSQSLSRFHMLAGRIKGNLIECSDEGALFLEAHVNAPMADFLKRPNLEVIPQFLPFPLVLSQPLETAIQIGVQINIFSCGGIAIGLSFLHKIIDGTTMSSFIKSWADSCNGKSEKLIRFGNYDSVSSLFPQREILPFAETPFEVSEGKSSRVRRFVFDSMKISNLKAKAKSISVPKPTSLEVVTCFIWKYAMKAAIYGSDKKEVVLIGEDQNFGVKKGGSTLVHLVNMRKRIQPPLSEYNVGNIFWRSRAYYEASNTEIIKLNDLENTLRKSLLEINSDFIRKLTGDNGFGAILSSFEQLHEFYAKSCESYTFTSWRNMGLNEVNFGWGKPIWIGNGGNVYESKIRNLVVLMDTTNGDGIEAWVVLDDETMNILENDIEFLEFASLNPSIPLA